MKTNQNLIRKMGDFDVIQRTSDGYFDANNLMLQWNSNSKNPQRKMTEFTESATTKEFIEALKNEMSKGENSLIVDFQPIKKIKGKAKSRGGRLPDKVWMHPFVFIDFAMWINPTFKVKVVKFVYDELIRYRNEAGDAYKDMTGAIASIVSNKKELPVCIKKVARALNYIVYNSHERELRNKQAEENKARELAELEKDIAKLINQGFIRSFNNLVNYLRRLWREKYMPKELRA
jgi:hypothetical protein